MNITQQIINLIHEVNKEQYTLSIAKVVAVNRPALTCDVILKYRNYSDRTPPILRDVPVAVPRGFNSLVMFPVNVEDVVLLAFTKEPAKPALANKDLIQTDEIGFSIANAIIISGFVLGSEKGATITGTQKYELPTDRMVVVSDQKIDIVAPLINLAEPAANDKVVRKSDIDAGYLTATVSGNTSNQKGVGPNHYHQVNIGITIVAHANTGSQKVRSG